MSDFNEEVIALRHAYRDAEMALEIASDFARDARREFDLAYAKFKKIQTEIRDKTGMAFVYKQDEEYEDHKTDEWFDKVRTKAQWLDKEAE